MKQNILLIFFSLLLLAPVPSRGDVPVRVGVYDYKPFVFRSLDGKAGGLYIEVLEHMAKAEKWQLDYVKGSWTECIERLKTGKIDLMIGIAYSENRARFFDFNRETFMTNWGRLYARKNLKIDSIAALEGKKIAFYKDGVFSEYFRKFLKQTGITCEIVEAEDYDTIFRLVDEGEVDAGVSSNIFALQHARRYRAEKTAIIFMPTELRFAVAKGRNRDLTDAIDRHLVALKSDPDSIYHRALDKWTVSRLEAMSRDRLVPRWAVYTLAGAGCLALLFLLSSLLLEKQVRRKTLAISEKNEILNREIRKREKTEQALEAHRRQLTTLMDNLPGMVYRSRTDDARTIEFISSGCERLLGYTPEYLAAHGIRTFKKLVYPDDFSAIESHPEPENGYPWLYRMKTRSGGYKWVCDYGVASQSLDGAIPIREGFITDVTGRQEEEIRLRRENVRLRSAMKERFRFGDIVGKSRVMQEVYEMILKAAATHEHVILYGESGTGKELVARAIHDMSDRSQRAFVPVNCGAIPANLLESEFFGHKKGAFTGADADKTGFMDRADGGTLFLDEIGDIDLNMQVMLLRAIEGGGFTPVGGTGVRKPDIRIVAATNKDLESLVKKGLMRRDFYYRIHIVPIFLPPLRKRKEDIALLIEHFLNKYDPEILPPVTGNIIEALRSYDWPGNVRELQNVLNRYVTLKKLDFPGLVSREPEPVTGEGGAQNIEGLTDLRKTMENFEKAYIEQVLIRFNWHRGKTAEILNINRKTLFKKIKAHGLKM
ncbi:MAG: transporter substrate-binding domain-containing protein [Desulfobacteraceae bacterium]|nr:transporter substrate-binding domain-containing protein [Desulfobacteraceae bacterium]